MSDSEIGEEEETFDYKDHYRRVLVDMIGRRDRGFLDSEEAVEGFASTSQRPSEGSHTTVTETLCAVEQLGASFKGPSISSGVSSTSRNRLFIFEDLLDENPDAVDSESQLLQNRRCPEGDQRLSLVHDPIEENTDSTNDFQEVQLTPEPSLIAITDVQKDISSQTTAATSQEKDDSKTERNVKKKKAWNRILKGIKNPLVR